jgi:GTPase
MEPEPQEGNIEYKLKLVDKSEDRIEQLATQMRWRCSTEGNGECIYNLGVEDDGSIVGLTSEEYSMTVDTIKKIANMNNYHITQLSKTETENDQKYMYELLIRENNNNNYIDINVAVAGPVDAGKSSFLGSLTTGKLDDGKGSARLSIFNYPHEIKTGRTSSVGHHIIGYDKNGDIVNYSGNNGKLSWPDIVKRSSKIISLFDLAGHEKYLKTTILGLTANTPDLCLIMVGANKGIRNEKRNTKRNIKQKRCDNMTKEHMFLCITLGIPFAIVITKIDMIIEKNLEDIYKQTMEDIRSLIKCPGIRRHPIEVKSKEDVLICSKQVHTESIVPIFTVSNVTGAGQDNIKEFLNLLMKKNKNKDNENTCMYIENIWSVPGVGTVVGGKLSSGTVKVNDKVYIGPNNGTYETTIVRSIHCKRVPVQYVSAGSFVCLALKKFDRKNVRRGNVMVTSSSQKIAVKNFKADIKVLRSHATTIRVGYESVLHVGSIRQTVTLLEITNKVSARSEDKTSDSVLRTGDTAIGTFMFCNQPEYITKGMKLLFSEGKTKVIGNIVEV